MSSFAYEQDRELVQQNMGVPAALVQEMLEYARGERTLYSAEVEYGLLSLAEARQLGLDEAWIDRVTGAQPEAPHRAHHRPHRRGLARGRSCWSRATSCSRSTARSSTASPTRARRSARPR
jgi:hypothetical protein